MAGRLARSTLFLAVFLWASRGLAQGETRSELLAALRAAKAEDIAAGRIPPEGSDKLERVVNYVEEGPFLGWFAEDFAGFHPVVGDLATGSGLALGLAYAYPFVHSDAFVHASASISTHLYRRLHVDATLPTFGNLSVNLRAQHRNYPQMLFFGLGTDTPEGARTSYRLVDTGLRIEASYRLLPWLSAGVDFEGFGTDIGPGTIDDIPATENAFDEETAPGIEDQPNFLASDVFAAVDFRDVPRNAFDNARPEVCSRIGELSFVHEGGNHLVGEGHHEARGVPHPHADREARQDRARLAHGRESPRRLRARRGGAVEVRERRGRGRHGGKAEGVPGELVRVR